MKSEHKDEDVHFDLEKKAWNTSQLRVISIFLLVVVSWVMREWIVEWTGIPLGDEHIAMIGALLMFITPAQDEELLLEWKDTKNLEWGILLLFGGGLALAAMFESHGVVTAMGDALSAVGSYGLFVVLLIVVTVAIFGTEIMSNTAMVNVFAPVIAALAISSDLSVVSLCLPMALSASCAFMLPVGTPPNAIVFGSGRITIPQMAKTGFLLNVIAVVIVTLFSYIFIS